MSAEIEIRPVSGQEAPILLALSRKTFFDAFAHRNTAEDMALYADANLTLEKITAELQNTNSNFFFAIINNLPVGYLKLNRGAAQTDVGDSNAAEVERIYVDQAHQGKQIGAKLMDFAVTQARAWHASYIWLGVWEHNTQAIKFYEREGFAVFGSHPFILGADRQTDILMKFAL